MWNWNILLELSNEYPLLEFTGIDKTKLFPSLIKPNQWAFIMSELIRVAKPGGYIEVQGFDSLQEQLVQDF
ncbi:hypothetical protein RhiirB3_454556 [Rhizophagus irregularis]|nr:hypothetical protein RhiirB3_454556 [Rhizophagus irregularis]